MRFVNRKSSDKSTNRPVRLNAGTHQYDRQFPGKQSSGYRERKTIGSKIVEANARLTASIAVVLLVLLALEGLTLLRIASAIQLHVFIGMVLLPLVALKIISVSYRFFKYYTGHTGFQKKGPPVMILRVLGPFIIVLSVVLLVSGLALLFVPLSMRNELLFIHKASFVLWFLAMTVHVLGHLAETLKFAPKDYYAKTRKQLQGAGLRQWTIAACLAIGILLGALMLPRAGAYFPAYFHQQASKVHLHK